MTPDQLGRIMEAIRSRCNVDRKCEITIEVNPGTADHEKLRAYRALGVNRLSIGTQSFVPEELRLLGRIHTAGDTREVFRAAREAGFENISLDLMSALPGQTVESWLFNLEQAVRLSPEHLSCYSLIIEEGTPLERMFARKELPPLPSEEDDRAMYHLTREFLSKYGFDRYEISNYARAGFESRHNLGYWTGRPYLGLGLGASSYLGGKRFHDPENMEAYEEAVRTNCVGLREDVQELSDTDRMSEFMFLGLRLTKGVSEEEFAARFGKTMQEVYRETIRRQIGQGLLERSDGRVYLTEYGLDVANYVMADYLL